MILLLFSALWHVYAEGFDEVIMYVGIEFHA